MWYSRCPFCNNLDGDNDIIISKELKYAGYDIAEVIETKICDICGKTYKVMKKYIFNYEKYTDETLVELEGENFE